MKKSLIYIFIIVGAIFLIFGAIYSIQPRAERAAMKDAIYIDNGKLDKANEGKLVILAGRLEAELPFTDPDTKVKIPYLTAIRTVYEFVEAKNKDEYTWKEVDIEGNRENNGVNLEGFTTTTLVAPVRIGDYNIDPRIFSTTFARDDWEKIDEDYLVDCELYLFKSRYDGKTYLSEIEGIHDTYNKYEGEKWAKELGKKKCRYKVYKEIGPYEFTVFGVQKGNWLMKRNDIDMLSEEEGILSAKEFIKRAVTWRKIIGAIAAVLGIALIGFATYHIILEKKYPDIY